MAKVDWRFKGKYLKNCNCDYGCPCDFWSKPTHTKCEGMMAMEIVEGHYGKTPLTGLKFAALYHWPGPLHEGNGTVQPIVDEQATPAQREAILTIMSGQAGGPWFELLASIVTTLMDPVFAPIRMEYDLEARSARVVIPGLLETVTEPIRNVANGDAHRIQVNLPNGIEYRNAETACAAVNKATGGIAYNWPNSHSSLAYVEHTPAGLHQ